MCFGEVFDMCFGEVFGVFVLFSQIISCCLYLFNIALFEGEFLPPFYILCYNLYVLSSSKRGRLLTQKVTLSIYICFDDNKPYKSYLVLIKVLE